jgi:hypothetical protein
MTITTTNICGATSTAEDVLSGIDLRGYALDPKSAEALWKKSEEMVGESL